MKEMTSPVEVQEENWQFYYLRRKQSAERAMQKYYLDQREDLSPQARSAAEHEVAALVEAGNKTASAFQLVDDLLSLRPGSDDYGSDISEGKKTLPVIAAAQNGHSNKLMDILSQHTTDPDLISAAIQMLHESGAITFTQQVARTLVDESRELITSSFEDTRYRRILFSIMEYGLQRNE